MTHNGLKDILYQHRGRDHAIPSRVLCDMTGLEDRALRLLIDELIDEGMSIVSVTEPPAGYFVASSREEAQRYSKSLQSRAVKIFLRRRKIIRNASLRVEPEQLSLC